MCTHIKGAGQETGRMYAVDGIWGASLMQD